MTMVCIRFVIATVILNVLLRKFDPAARLRRDDILPLAASGLFGVTIYFFFEVPRHQAHLRIPRLAHHRRHSGRHRARGGGVFSARASRG